MKKFWVGILLFTVLPLHLHAAITDEGVTREKTLAIHISSTIPVGNVTASTPSIFCLIQLSSTNLTTGSWPHQEMGEIDISHIHIDINKIAASSGSVRIGVVTFVNQSTGAVTFFMTRDFSTNVSNTDPTLVINETPSFFRCRVYANTANVNGVGTTPFIVSNDTRSNSTLYTSRSQYLTPLGSNTGFLKAGDIVAEVTDLDATATMNVTIDLMYHSEK